MAAQEHLQPPFLKLMGNEFSVVDVAVGSMLAYTQILLRLDLSQYSKISNYLKNISQRSAFKDTIGKR